MLLTHKYRFYGKTIKLRHYPPPVILAAFLTSAMTVFLFTSCSRTELAPMQYDTPDSRLLTDIPSDALDYGNASTLSNSLYDYVQIPIHASTPLDYASVRFPLIPDGKTPSETAGSPATAAARVREGRTCTIRWNETEST